MACRAPDELTARIGQGGMGEVWRALDTRLNCEVAIRVVGRSRPAAIFDFWVQSIESQRGNIDATT